MLVLSRRPGQSIMIGKEIAIVVLGSDGVQVRVGIRAPREVTVLRRELLKQVEEENKRAVVTNLGAALGQIGAGMLGGVSENGVEATSVPPVVPPVAAPVASPVNGPATPPRRRRVGAA